MKTPETNFYVTGGTLRPDAPSYVERSADRELVAALVQGEFCYVLTSRQMGKSSLMVRTAQKLREQNIDVVVLDLTAVGQNLTPEQWYDGLLLRVGQQLHLEDDLEDFWLNNQRIGLVQRFFEAIRKVVLRDPAKRLVVFIDELDVVRSLPFSTDEFFAALRECYMRRIQDAALDRLTFCLLGVATPTDLIRDTRITPFNVGKRIELNDFTRAEARFLALGLRGWVAENDAKYILDRILYWTNGHPYLTQRMCQAIAALAREQAPKKSPRLVDGLCDNLFFSYRARERDDNLVFVRDRILRSEEDRAALLDIYLKVLRGRRLVDDEKNRLVALLRLSGIIRVIDGILQVRNRIYARAFDAAWIRANMPDAELRRQSAAFWRGTARTAGALLVVVGALTLYAIKLSQLATERRERADAEARERRVAQEAYTRAKESSGQALLAQARAERMGGQAGQRFNALAAIGRAAEIEASPRLRDEAIACLALPVDLRTKRGWPWLSKGDVPIAVDSKLKRYVRASGTNIAVRQLEDDQELFRMSSPGPNIRQTLLSRDGRFLAIEHQGDRTETLQVLNLDTKAEVLNLSGPFPNHLFDFQADGQRLAVGFSERRIEVHDLTSGRKMNDFAAHARPSAIRLHPHGNVVAVSSQESLVVRILKLDTDEVVASFSHPKPVLDVAWHPNGKYVASACADRAIYVWEMKNDRQPLAVLRGAEGLPRIIVFSRKGDLLASVGDDEILRLWNPFSERQLVRTAAEGITRLEFSKDDNYLFSTVARNRIEVWELTKSREYRVFRAQTEEGGLNDMAILPNGRLAASAGSEGVELWDLAVGERLATMKGIGNVVSVQFDFFTARANKASTAESAEALPPVQSGLITSDLYGLRRFQVHAHANDRDLWRVGAPSVLLRPPVAQTVISVDGRLLAAVHEGIHIHVFEQQMHEGTHFHWQEQREASKAFANREGIKSIALSANGTWLAATFPANNWVRIWNVSNRIATATVPARSEAHIAFSPDGQWLVTGAGDEYRFWKSATGEKGRGIPRFGVGDQPGPLAFSHDGKMLAIAASSSLVQLVVPDTGEILATLEPPEPKRVVCLSFTPDDTQLAVMSSELIQVWNLLRLRQQLAAMKLNWNPPLPASAPLKEHFEPIRLAVNARSLAEGATETEQELKERLSEYSTMIALEPEDPEAYHLRGHVYGDLGEWESALADFKQALKLEFDAATIHRDCATAYSALQRSDEAEADATEAIRLEPQVPSNYDFRAKLYLEGRRYDMAAADLGTAIELSRQPIGYLAHRAVVYIQTGEWERARADYLRIAEIDPDEVQSHLDVALASVAMGDLNSYRQRCELLLQRFLTASNHGIVSAVTEMAALLPNAVTNFSPVPKAAAEVIQNHGDNPEFLLASALVFFRAGRTEEAIQQLENLPVSESESALLRARQECYRSFILASCYQKSQHRQQARYWFDKADEIYQESPGNVNARNPFAWYDRVKLKALRREAESLLKEVAGPGQ